MGFYFFLVSVLVLSVSAEDAPKPSPPNPPPPSPSPENLQLADTYFNFSMGVGLIYSEALTNETMSSGSEPSDDGVIVTSILGLVHTLAVMKEQPLSKPIAIPLFDKLLAITPKSLPDAYELLMGTLDKAERDLVISSHLFTSEEVKSIRALTKYKLEIVKSDLKDAGMVAKINSQLKEKLASPLEEGYIPSGQSLSPAAQALMIDTLHLTESWPVKPTTLPKSKFGDDAELVEMIELKGMFGMVDSPAAIEINIPFQNGKRFISFALPKMMNLSIQRELDTTPPKISNGTELRIQLPVFKMTSRDLGFSGHANCDFVKGENFLQLLDDLMFISLDSNKLEAVAITGAQVNNVALFKEEAAKGKKDKPAAPAPTEAKPEAPLPTNKLSAESEKLEKDLFIFNQPFTFNIIDVNLGVLFSGSVESFKKTEKLPSKSTVFGMEKQLEYLNCL